MVRRDNSTVQATSEEHIYQTSRRYVSDDSSLNFRVSLARQFSEGQEQFIWRLRKIAKSNYIFMPAGMQQLCSHWKNFHEILCLIIFFRKYIEKIILLRLKSDKYNEFSLNFS